MRTAQCRLPIDVRLRHRHDSRLRISRAGRRQGFTIIELIVVMAVISVLLALTLPAIGRARQAARRTQCQNNLRNLALGLTSFDTANQRLPASGYIFEIHGFVKKHHSWAISVLPYIGEQPLADAWNLRRPIDSPVNAPLTLARIPVFICPSDITRSPKVGGGGDQSYVVNGGVGYTTMMNDVRDCAVDPSGNILDLNGNGVECPPDPETDGTPSDRDYFKDLGLFFLENWNRGGTLRHYTLADIGDGLSQTFMVTENVRTGYDPDHADSTFASPDPRLCAFYIGSPCRDGNCSAGNVNYNRCNAGSAKINSGLESAEGVSPVPNSFHDGGVNMAYADGRVSFLSESVDGAVYAALASMRGSRLQKSPLAQVIVSDLDY
jgi:prepilin-type N-terminal cleavage/methylation domain-containing protein/prepilin-type processing-associated H-X9-DG protein